MNIALITLEGGGISTVCHGLGKSLARKKISTTIFTETSGNREVEVVNDNLEIIRLHRVNLPPRFFWFQRQNIQYLLNALGSFSLIHGVSPDASTFVASHRQKLKMPFVASFHAEPLTAVRGLFETPLSSWTPQEFAHGVLEFPIIRSNVKKCIENADRIIFCSYSALSEFKAEFENLDLDKASVIYNAVNLSEIGNERSITTLRDKKDLTIIFAGRLFWVKGLQNLLKAFEMISKDFRNVHLEIFGTGPDEIKFKKLVSKLGLNDKVNFHGRIPHRALIAEIKKADLAVAPSMHEAQSMYVLEAMACGKTVIAFDIPSMREIITDGLTGVLAKSFDTRDLSEKLHLLLSDQELRGKLGQNAKNYVSQKHNGEKQIEQYLQIYSKLIN